jgi:hypothetical protein
VEYGGPSCPIVRASNKKDSTMKLPLQEGSKVDTPFWDAHGPGSALAKDAPELPGALNPANAHRLSARRGGAHVARRTFRRPLPPAT